MIGLMELKGIVGQAAVTITAVENKEKTVQIDLCDIVNCGGNKRAWRGYDMYGCVWPSYYVLQDSCTVVQDLQPIEIS